MYPPCWSVAEQARHHALLEVLADAVRERLEHLPLLAVKLEVVVVQAGQGIPTEARSERLRERWSARGGCLLLPGHGQDANRISGDCGLVLDLGLRPCG